MYKNYLADDLWLIKETKWVKSLQNVRESQFTLGNGYVCTRGILEGVPYDSYPGTFIAGLYDKMGSQVDELVNLPNPINFRITTGGQKLEVLTMDILKHRRILNLKKGLLVRQTVFKDAKKRRVDYQSCRFLSMHNRNIGVMQVALTPLDEDCRIDVNTEIDTSVINTTSFSEGKRKHFKMKEVGQYRDSHFLITDTLEKKHTIIYWSGFYYQLKGRKIFAKDNAFRLLIKKNQTVIFTKVFFVKHFPCKEDSQRFKERSYRIFLESIRTPFSVLLDKHINSWEKTWKKADVIIEGTADLQRNFRFNIYHMLICAHYDDGFSSIGARTLSGEGYRGHIFWDADIFLLPFFIFHFPNIAKNMLLYRYKRLNQARKLAKKGGYRGAQFVWESASSGEEETPSWARDIDGTITKVHTHEMEHHVTACVAYAVYQYFVATEDVDFMEKCGYELMLETARFWASRVTYNKRKKTYGIDHVIGPDEFHIDVNNNAFTNMMAKWNLLTAYKLFSMLKRTPKILRIIKEKLKVDDKEARTWQKIAARMAMGMDKNKVIEQFDGYFKLKQVPLTKTDENGVPLVPRSLKAKNVGKTQLIKQADVIMLLYLLNDQFSPQTKKNNYQYYIQRTVHKSSLSAAVNSCAASEVQDLNRAYNLFNVSLRADISNLYGNTQEGIHAASLGGTWQAAVFGFAGLRIKKGTLFINPTMPYTWDAMIFSFYWKGDPIKLELSNSAIKIAVVSRKKRIELGIYDRRVTLQSGRKYTFKRRIPKHQKEYGYY